MSTSYISVLTYNGANIYDWYGLYNLPTTLTNYPLTDGYCLQVKPETGYNLEVKPTTTYQNESVNETTYINDRLPIVDGKLCS